MQERNAGGRRKEVSGSFQWDLFSVGGNVPGLEKGSASSTSGLPPTCTHSPVKAESLRWELWR